MKYIFIFISSIIILSSCSCSSKDSNIPKAKRVVYVPGYDYIYEFTYQEHNYLYNYRTGIIHSASCKSPEHYDTK